MITFRGIISFLCCALLISLATAQTPPRKVNALDPIQIAAADEDLYRTLIDQMNRFITGRFDTSGVSGGTLFVDIDVGTTSYEIFFQGFSSSAGGGLEAYPLYTQAKTDSGLWVRIYGTGDSLSYLVIKDK